MKVITGEKEKNLSLAKRFEMAEFWKEDYKELFDDYLTMEFPFAPPGWLQKLSSSETRTHMEWLQHTIKNWEWSKSTVYGTNFPNIVILKRDGAGDVHWAGKDGKFESRFITMLTMEHGRIVKVKDYFSPLAMMEAIGIVYPVIPYDAPPLDSIPDRAPVPYVADDPEKLRQRIYDTLKMFVAVDFWSDDDMNANDIVHELPFAPPDMPVRYEGKEYDQLNLWIGVHAPTWVTYPGSILYETDEDGVYFIESGGVGTADWTGEMGTYQQRELSFLRIVDGYAKEFHEYFNPINKFNSGGVSVLSFPYLY